MIVDERGTGASFGEWPYPLQERALEDGREVIDWVLKCQGRFATVLTLLADEASSGPRGGGS